MLRIKFESNTQKRICYILSSSLCRMSCLHIWFSKLKWSMDVLLRFYERHAFICALHKETRLLFDELIFCLQVSSVNYVIPYINNVYWFLPLRLQFIFIHHALLHFSDYIQFHLRYELISRLELTQISHLMTYITIRLGRLVSQHHISQQPQQLPLLLPRHRPTEESWVEVEALWLSQGDALT